VAEPQLEDIGDKLAAMILSRDSDEHRDTGSIGLKTLVVVLTHRNATCVLKRIVPKLLVGIAQVPPSPPPRCFVAPIFQPHTCAYAALHALTPPLPLTPQDAKPEVPHACMEILNELLKKFGGAMAKDIQNIKDAIIPRLSAPSNATRKRASACVGTGGGGRECALRGC
jgi:hypothetical protein